MELVEEIEAALRRRGHVQVRVNTDADADEWRRAARAAARRLGRPVETVQQRHIVVAALKDWPLNELEQQVNDAATRNEMDRIGELSS